MLQAQRHSRRADGDASVFIQPTRLAPILQQLTIPQLTIDEQSFRR